MKTTKRARRWVVVALVIATLVGAGGAYAVLGWQRMETYCPSGADYHHTWEWSPVGFTCAAEDGSTKSSLWWSRPFHLAERPACPASAQRHERTLCRHPLSGMSERCAAIRSAA